MKITDLKNSPAGRAGAGRPAARAHLRLARGCFVALALLGGGLSSASAATPPELPPLADAADNPRLPGKFVWVDLVTDDVPAARKFYGALLGWTFKEAGDYTIAENDGRPLAGMIQRARPKGQPGQPRWFGYISVPNVADTVRAASAAGGRVLAPLQSLPKRGQQAVLADPEGALFGVIESSLGDPPDFLPDPGDWIWAQLLSHNGAKAADFYRTVGGYEVIENPLSNRVADFILVSSGYARATVRTLPRERAEIKPTWLPFVRVKRVNDAVIHVGDLGGRVLITPKPDLLDGRVAVIADPTGAAVGLIEWNENSPTGTP